MVRRPKPRWGWEPTRDSPELLRRKRCVDFDHVIALFGETVPDPEVPLDVSLELALDSFFDDAFGDSEPTLSERQAAVDEIEKHLVALRDRVGALDYVTRAPLMEALLLTYHERRRRVGREPTLRALARAAPNQDAALTTLDFLIKAIETVDLPLDPIRRGRRPNTAMQEFILRLAGIYQEHTDRSPLEGFYRNAMTERYEGTLVEIAEHLLDRFAPELNISNAAIGEHIRRTIGDRAK